jgi:hypothetical protein
MEIYEIVLWIMITPGALILLYKFVKLMIARSDPNYRPLLAPWRPSILPT